LKVVADSSAWIAYFRSADTEASKKLRGLIEFGGERVALCGPVLTEVLQGVTHEHESRRIAEILDAYEFLHTDKASFSQAGQIYRRCRAGGFTIRSSIDCIIAATALRHDADILHDDRDYDVIAKFFPVRIF
jgi:predicted nucleic acid-binding protein